MTDAPDTPRPASQTLTIRPIGADQYDLVAHLRVAPHQIKFSGTVAQAFELAEPQVDFHAICLDARPVGFFKIDRGYAATHHFARPGEPGIRALLIDLAHQGQGLATAAVRLMSTYLPERYPEAESVVLTVNMANPAATRCYRNAGFVDTGEIHEGGIAGPQLVMRMPLRG